MFRQTDSCTAQKCQNPLRPRTRGSVLSRESWRGRHRPSTSFVTGITRPSESRAGPQRGHLGSGQTHTRPAHGGGRHRLVRWDARVADLSVGEGAPAQASEATAAAQTSGAPHQGANSARGPRVQSTHGAHYVAASNTYCCYLPAHSPACQSTRQPASSLLSLLPAAACCCCCCCCCLLLLLLLLPAAAAYCSACQLIAVIAAAAACCCCCLLLSLPAHCCCCCQLLLLPATACCCCLLLPAAVATADMAQRHEHAARKLHVINLRSLCCCIQSCLQARVQGSGAK
jgi:hypothetical protein